jgi:hypothetical protein
MGGTGQGGRDADGDGWEGPEVRTLVVGRAVQGFKARRDPATVGTTVSRTIVRLDLGS